MGKRIFQKFFQFCSSAIILVKGQAGIAIFCSHEQSTKMNSRKQPHACEACLHTPTLQEIRPCPQLSLFFGRMLYQWNPIDFLCWVKSQNLPSYDFGTIFLKVSGEALKFPSDLKICFWKNKDNRTFTHMVLSQSNLWEMFRTSIHVKQILHSPLNNQINNLIM